MRKPLCADAWGPRRLGALGAWAPEGLGKAFHPPSKISPYATTHSYVGASGPSSLLLRRPQPDFRVHHAFLAAKGL